MFKVGDIIQYSPNSEIFKRGKSFRTRKYKVIEIKEKEPFLYYMLDPLNNKPNFNLEAKHVNSNFCLEPK